MEFLIFIIVVGVVSYIYELITKDSSSAATKTEKKVDIELLDLDSPSTSKFTKKSNDRNVSQQNNHHTNKSKDNITNNYYTQNIVNVQINNNSNSSSKKSPNKDHTEKVWKELGYKVKNGETYSYKFYGNEIFIPEQVENISTYGIKYSKKGLANKLLKNTGSKRMAKDILVEQYNCSDIEAKKLVGYR